MPDAKEEDYYLASKGFPIAYDPASDPAVQEHQAEAEAIRAGKSGDQIITPVENASESEIDSSDDEVDDEKWEDEDPSGTGDEEPAGDNQPEESTGEDQPKKQLNRPKKKQSKAWGPYDKVRIIYPP